jgi:glycosyltransferase involved in cell wall biosynthesis
MIVKDEAYFMDRCLRSVKDYVDEIVIVDTGSNDGTVDIARGFTDKVFDFQWIDDFAAARNFSLGKATGDWILVLDADELIEPSDLEKIRATIRTTDQDAFFLIQYNYNNDSLVKDWQPVREKTAYSGDYKGYRRNPAGRLFRSDRGIHFQGAVHEIIDQSLDGLSYEVLEIPIHHHMEDNPDKPKVERQLNYLRMIQRALDKGPDGRLAASAGGVCMHFKQDYPQAIAYFRQAIDLGHEVDANRESLAEALYRGQQFAEARAIYEALHGEGHRSFSICLNLANLLVKEGNPMEAVKLLKEALALGVADQDVAAKLQHNVRFLEDRINQA